MHVLFDLWVLDSVVYRTSMVQNRMNEQGGRQRKCEKVDHRKGTGEIQRAIGLVLVEVELMTRGIEYLCDIVRLTEAVVRALPADRHICEVPGLYWPFVRRVRAGWGEQGENLRWCDKGLVV